MTYYMLPLQLIIIVFYWPGLICIRQSLMFHNKHRGRSTCSYLIKTLFISSGTCP